MASQLPNAVIQPSISQGVAVTYGTVQNTAWTALAGFPAGSRWYTSDLPVCCDGLDNKTCLLVRGDANTKVFTLSFGNITHSSSRRELDCRTATATGSTWRAMSFPKQQGTDG